MGKATLAMAVLSLFVAAPLFAQAPGPGGPGGRGRNGGNGVQREVKRLTTLLDLTPGQQTSLTTLLTNNAAANQPLMKSMWAANKALHAAEQNNDSAGIQSASAQIGTITGQLTANRSTLNAGLAGIFTTDQMNKYKLLGHGPGGFGGGFHRGGPGGPSPGGPGGGQ